MTETAFEIEEHIGGEFGVTVRYKRGDSHVEFFAAEVCGRTESGGPIFMTKGEPSFPCENESTTLDTAERYVDGSVKWDGCSHYYFGDENGYLHLCGLGAVRKLSATVAAIHKRCGELMKGAGINLLDGEFDESATVEPVTSVVPPG